MLRENFQKMAARVVQLDDEALIDTGAHLLIHALTVAHDHEIGEVRAFANGCTRNTFADDMRPMLFYQLPEEEARLRVALSDIFAMGGVDQVWSRWAGPEADPRAGLMRFLNNTTPSHGHSYSRLAA